MIGLFMAAALALSADTTAQMVEIARQMRVTAEQMRGQLPPEEIAEMLASADQIERDALAGAYAAPTPAAATSADPAARIMAEHDGRTEWLARETACTGYSWENYRTFRLSTGDRDAERDKLCQVAYRHWEDYFLTVRNGGGTAKAAPALEAYDAAAHAAVDFYERR
ncbi:hypothetical protein [Caulobacter sp. 17J65-9]|uniref:hypothetical protein n=1 Tax=Caulobacter sp. 17J65-9 TaxID=2709382 RepID=UPI0013CD91A7|nr:hypothetical protein [Caulobacter sp. 17J65-9]NEX93193.1 hypothetical protein [Caulobacter sp. 17J65-9]